MNFLRFLLIFAIAVFGGVGNAKAQSTTTVAYRPDLGEASPLLDIYSFDGAANAPVVIFVHGGTWQTGQRQQGPNKIGLFNDAGFIYVSIDYRLVPEVRIEDELVDVEYAVKWVSDHIAQYGGNGQNIHLFGHSAGAHLVTMLAIAPRSVARSLVRSGVVRSVYASDLHTYDFLSFAQSVGAHMPPAYSRAIGTDLARIATLSPLQNISPARRIPDFLISFSAQRNSAELRRSSAYAFAEALRAAGGRAEVFDGSRYNHKTIIRAVGTQPDISDAVIGFFQAHAE